MITLKLPQKKISIKEIKEKFVESIKIYGVIKPLQKKYGNKHFEDKLKEMRHLPKDTIGNDLAKILDLNNLKLIPKFENHDLKHLVLGYGMTTQDEIKMQAYLLGNGSRKLTCILFLLSGILFPSLWKEYYQEYQKGKSSPSILKLSLEDCMRMQTHDMRKKYIIN